MYTYIHAHTPNTYKQIHENSKREKMETYNTHTPSVCCAASSFVAERASVPTVIKTRKMLDTQHVEQRMDIKRWSDVREREQGPKSL